MSPSMFLHLYMAVAMHDRTHAQSLLFHGFPQLLTNLKKNSAPCWQQFLGCTSEEMNGKAI